MSIHIRRATESDSFLILTFITELAQFEGKAEEISATETDIKKSLFQEKQAEVLIAELDNKPVAFALFYPIYSTFSGGQNLFLEDLFVRKKYRGKGIGRELMKHLANIAIQMGAKRIDWYVLESNENGAKFYKKLGAVPLMDRRTYRICTFNIKSLANGVISDV